MKNFYRVSAIVTLGTPFITVEPRPWAPPMFYSLSLACWLTIALNYFIGDHFDFKGGFRFLYPLLITLGFAGALYPLLKRAKQEADRISLVNRSADPGNTPLLVVRHGFDEAGLWLRALVLPRILDSPLTFLGKLFIGTNWVVKILWVIGWLFLFVVVFQFRIPLADTFLFGSVMLLLLIPPLSAISTLIYSHRFGFGGSLSLKHLFVQVRPEAGMRTAYVKKFSGLRGVLRTSSFRPFRISTPHSLGYSDPKAIEAIGNWLELMLPSRRNREQINSRTSSTSSASEA